MRKEIFIPVFILFLGIIFAVISILVFFSNGKKRYIHWKLKIGAIIISLTSIYACNSPHPTCYEIIPKKQADSMRLADSLNYVEKIINKQIEDSIAFAKEEKRINDSIANVNKMKKKKNAVTKEKYLKIDHVRPVCYGAPANTCYTSVAPKNDSNSLK